MELKPVEGKRDRYELNKNTQLQQSYLGEWSIIRPVTIDNKIHWPNLLYGGKITNVLVLVILLFLLLFGSWSYARDTEECRDLMENPPRCGFETFEGGMSKYPNLNESIFTSREKIQEGNNEHYPSIFTQDNDKPD